jgi:glycosyltransferase involved in cell wall biosynthesis
MKVAVVIYSPRFFGGGNKFASELLSCLIESGLQVSICAFELPIKGMSYDEFFKVKNWFIPNFKWNIGKLYKIMFNERFALKNLVKNFKPDVIIGADTEPCIMFDLKVKKIFYTHFPTELKIHARSLIYKMYRSIFWQKHYNALKELDFIACNSEYTRNITYMLWNNIQPNKNKYVVIYPCINTKKFANKLNKDFNRICYVGRLDKNKGINYVLDAFREISKCVPNSKLDIVGGVKGSHYAEKYYPELMSNVKNMDNVRIRRDVPDNVIVETLSKSRCLISYNPFEHFGIVPVEAMAAGCIPIVAEGGGQRETIIHGETGFLVKSPKELAIYAKKILTDDKLFKDMSKKAIAYSKKFDRQEFRKKWINLLSLL